MQPIQLIQALSNASGVSGFEDEVLTVARDYFKDDYTLEEDHIRNLFIRKASSDPKKPVVMLDAHSDEVGFMIQAINANGTLRFLPLGGWNPQSVSAHAVRIKNCDGDWVKGIIASKPTHFLTAEEQKSGASIASMSIDIGAINRDEAVEQFGIKLGAPVVPDVAFRYDETNDRMFGKAFDDRLGCAALLQVMKNQVNEQLNVDLAGALSSQEELGLRGARISVRKINPDVAIVLEGTPADDTFNSPDFIQAGITRGPQIRHMDSSILSNPRFVRFAIDIARDHGIPFQEAVRSSGGTNAGVITLHHKSVPTITLGIPVRYIHSHHGIAVLEDFKGAVQWCTQIITHLTREIIEGF